MEYKLLEQNGIENENVDGAAFNNFVANGKDCVIKGILNSCTVYSAASNHIGINTGELLIHGFRVKITEPYEVTLSGTPAAPIHYSIVAIIDLKSDRTVTFNIQLRESSTLIKDNLYAVEQGVYEAEIVRFTHDYNGIKDYALSVPVLQGGSGGGVDQDLIDQVETNKQDIATLQSEKVSKTDYATGDVAGIVRVRSDRGIAINGAGVSQGLIELVPASDAELTSRAWYKPITSGILDKAIVVGISTNTITLSEEEKTSALEWLGATEKFAPLHTPYIGNVRVWTSNGTGGYWEIVQSNDASAVNGNIPKYRPQDSGTREYLGWLLTHTPVNPYQCANKKYVDDSIATVNQQNAKMYMHKITINNSTTYPWGDVYFNIITSYPNAYTNDTFFTEKVYKAILGSSYVMYANYDGSDGAKTYTSGTFYKGENAYFAQGTMMVIDMLSYTKGTSILVIDGHHTLADEVIEL